ncbi:MAG: hypothetical protein AB1522_04470 [Chloroflexota bacterium]
MLHLNNTSFPCPLRFTDPSGENPSLLLDGFGGLLGGAAYGYGVQVIRNLNHGLCFWDALSFNIDAGQVALYAAVGTLLGTGLGAGAAGIYPLLAHLGTATTLTTTLSADGDPTNELKTTLQVGSQAIQKIPANLIRFTQSSISPVTRAGYYLDDLTNEIQNGFFRGYLRVVEYQGNLYSLDNRRLAAFKLLDEEIPVIIEDLSNPAIQSEFVRKFTTLTHGISILIRGTDIIIK